MTTATLPQRHHNRGARGLTAPGTPPAEQDPTSNVDAREADLLAADHSVCDAQDVPVGGSPLDPGQRESEAHSFPAGVDLASGHSSLDAQDSRAVANTLARDHSTSDAHSRVVSGSLAADHPTSETHSSHVGGSYFLLQLAAAGLDDIERTRMATGLRIGAMEREGLGDTPQLDAARALHEALATVERQAVKDLQRALRTHAFGPWVKRTVGVGEKQGARLIAAIGDPYWNTLEDRPRRGPAELWAYCGYAPAQKRRKGVQSNWNADAKMRAFLVAESCIKHRTSPYRTVYDAARLSWADRDTSDGHKHNHALRLVAKAVLKDLWIEGRRLHEATNLPPTQRPPMPTPSPSAP